MTSPTTDDVSNQSREEWFRQVLETAPDAMVIVGPDEKIQYVNVQTERLFGYARSELLGLTLETLIPERLRRNHRSHVARFFADPGTRPMGSGLELFGRRADGKEIAIEVSLSPVFTKDGALVSAALRDISERKRTEAKAKLAADRLSSAVESIQDAFALFDKEDQLVLCNSVFRRLVAESLPGPLVGKSHDEILDAWLVDLAFSNAEEQADFRRDRVTTFREHQSTFDVRTRDGRSLRVVDRRTIEGGTVRMIWDLTNDVRVAEELSIARAAAEAASAAKSDFLSSMSHELRTPLNAILGFAQLLRRDKREPLSERHQGRVTQILKGGEHLLRLIDDILDLSRIEAGAVSLSTEPVSVADVLRHVQSTLEPMAARSGLSVVVQIGAEPVPMLTADRTRFAQILMNFGSNAIKYNRPGGCVTFAVSRPNDGFVRVAVTDTGMGIPEEKQGKLFQPFQRAGQETGSIEGTGIGLVITKRLAGLMNGTVGFRSIEGEGSEFWVDMPIHALTNGALAAVPSPANEGPRLRAVGQRSILYIEDNPANVRFMEDLLGNFDGIELLTAPTAEIGVALARAKVPTVIIMDINLPGMSGLDALVTLRSIPETRAIPVIALTAAASDRDRQRGEEAGFYRYLTKPVQIDELEAALETLIGASS